jgi:hypothetical protein
MYICNVVTKPYGINTMKKFEFISETKYNKPNDPYFFTKEDGYFVSDSGSYDKDQAYEKFLLLVQGGSLKPTEQVLEEKILVTK